MQNSMTFSMESHHMAETLQMSELLTGANEWNNKELLTLAQLIKQ